MKSLFLFFFLTLFTGSAFASGLSEVTEYVLSGLTTKQLSVARKNLREYRRRALVVNKIFAKTTIMKQDQSDLLIIVNSMERAVPRLPSEFSYFSDKILGKLRVIKTEIRAKNWPVVEQGMKPWVETILSLPKI